MCHRLAVSVLLGVLGLASLLTLRLPGPLSLAAPPTKFSAARVMPAVERLAVEPHPLGSSSSDRVRDEVVRRLAAEGLDTHVQASGGLTASRGEVRGARVDNVVSILHGHAPTGTVVLSAHYDSVATGPGAADDMSSVAALLETVRALQAGPPLRNDVVVLVTDGEEAGLLGADAWVRDHLPRDRLCLTLNWEARGVSGPPLLFETSPGNAPLVRTFARTAPHRFGDSSLVEFYRILPNITDLSEVLVARRPGMNTAFIKQPYEYHSKLQLAAPGPTAMIVDDRTSGLDIVPGFVPRPDDLQVSPQGDSELVLVSRRLAVV